MSNKTCKIKFNNYVSKITPTTKPYYICCICLEESIEVKKCSKCIDGIICHNCRCNLTEEQVNVCPVCRLNTDSFVIEIKNDSESEINIVNKIGRNYCKSVYYWLFHCIRISFYSTLYLLLSFFVGMIISGIFRFNVSLTNFNIINFILIVFIDTVFNIILCLCLCFNKCLIVD